MTAPARDALPDALRALALIGVLIVNALGYAWAPSGPLLGLPQPADSVAAVAALGLVAALVQGKAYPALSLLFGMALVLSQRERTAAAYARARVRQRRLLVLGLLHGTLLYFGDILTLYALVTPFVLAHVHEPWRRLRPRLRRALGWALGSTLVLVLFSAAVEGGPPAAPPVETMVAATDGWHYLRMNAGTFWGPGLISILVGFPIVRLCMLAGVAATRLRLLTHRRWQPTRDGIVRRGLPLALMANIGYAALVVGAAQQGQPPAFWVDMGSVVVCLPLSLCLLVLTARLAWPATAAWRDILAPLGRRTLTLYIGHALWCIALYTDLGLGWRPGTLGVIGTSLALWLAAAAAAHMWPGRWPLEAWMGRRS